MAATIRQRFVPCGPASLSSDAPGWSPPGKSNDGNGVGGDTQDGPVCWKCRGAALRRKKEDQKEGACAVCKGRGRLPRSRRKEKALAARKGGTRRVGVIKKARPNPPGFAPFGPVAYALQVQNSNPWADLVRLADTEGVDCPAVLPSSSSAAGSRGGRDDGDDDTSMPSARIPSWVPQSEKEQLVKLVGHWRILQRIGSHRWTTDDLVTAYVAATSRPMMLSTATKSCAGDRNEAGTGAAATLRYLDLGCGNGSVLQMVSWAALKDGYKLDATGVEAR